MVYTIPRTLASRFTNAVGPRAKEGADSRRLIWPALDRAHCAEFPPAQDALAKAQRSTPAERQRKQTSEQKTLLTRGAQDSSVVARVEPIRDAKVSFIREQQEPSANSTCISNVLGEYITGLRKLRSSGGE